MKTNEQILNKREIKFNSFFFIESSDLKYPKILIKNIIKENKNKIPTTKYFTKLLKLSLKNKLLIKKKLKPQFNIEAKYKNLTKTKFLDS